MGIIEKFSKALRGVSEHSAMLSTYDDAEECPYCGKHGAVYIRCEFGIPKLVRCRRCGLIGGMGKGAEVIAKWNAMVKRIRGEVALDHDAYVAAQKAASGKAETREPLIRCDTSEDLFFALDDSLIIG